VTHMPIKFARRADVGSACVDIRSLEERETCTLLIAAQLYEKSRFKGFATVNDQTVNSRS